MKAVHVEPFSGLGARLVDARIGLLAILLFAIVAALPFTWTRGDELLTWGDGIFPGSVDFDTYRFAWAERFYSANPGRYVFSGFIDLPAYSVPAALQEVGLTPGSIQRLVLSTSLFLSGLLSYWAVLSLLGIRRSAAILASLLYTLNLHALVYVWMPHLSIYLSWAIMPATLALCAKVLQDRHWSHFLLLQGALFLHTLAFTNPAYVVLLWGALLSLALYLALLGQVKTRTALTGLAVIGLTWVVLNAWWILPSFFGIENMIAARYGFEASANSFLAIKYSTRYATFLNSWRMLGSNMLYYPQTNWIAAYQSQPILIFVGFLLPILSVYGIVARRRDPMTLYFGLMWILFLFLAKGIQPPLGYPMHWVYENIPGALAFRNSLEKFGHGAVLAQAFLIGLGVDTLCQRLQRRWHRGLLVGVLGVLLIGVYMWPAWSGAAAGRSEPTSTSPIAYAVDIPDSYLRVAEVIAQDPSDSFAMVVPRGGSGGFTSWYTLSWRYQGTEILTHLIEKPSLTMLGQTTEGTPNNVAGFVYEAILSPSQSLDTFLSMMNIGYVIVHNDINLDYQKVEPPQLLNGILSEQDNLTLVGDYGELSVYRVEGVLPAIYTTRDIIGVLGDIASLGSLVSLDTYRPHQSFLFNRTRAMGFGMEEGGAAAQSLIGDGRATIIVPDLDEPASQEGHHFFQFEAPQTAEYELLARAGGPSPEELRLDTVIVPASQGVDCCDPESQWHSWGRIPLSQGPHTIEILSRQPSTAPKVLLRGEIPRPSPPPRITFSKENPTRYLVHIQGATDPFLLVFLQTYHPGWTIRATGGTSLSSKHLLVNGYANGWWIDAQEGEYELILEFWPQRLLLFGLLVSIAGLLVVAMVVARKAILHKHEERK